MSKKGFVPSALLGMIFLIVLLSIGLVACSNGSVGTTGGQSSTATSQSVGTTQPAGTRSPSTSPVATQSGGFQLTPTPTLPASVQNCGTITISLHGMVPAGGNNANDTTVGNCFWQDYQQCKATTMNFRISGVDTITTHRFVATKIGNNCQIADTVQHIIAPNHIMNSATYACAGVNQDQTRLIFNSCGREGNVAVPLNQTYSPQE